MAAAAALHAARIAPSTKPAGPKRWTLKVKDVFLAIYIIVRERVYASVFRVAISVGVPRK
jgi:hypothetical protein